MAIVLSIGLVVDDAIVVVENSTRLLDTGKYSSKEAVEQAMGEITGPVVGVVVGIDGCFYTYRRLSVVLPGSCISSLP